MSLTVIIDASGLLYAAYHAIQQMTASSGVMTNALLGFANSLQRLLKECHPERIAVVFDGPDHLISRLSLDPNYKAHRKEMPPELRQQITLAKELCQLKGLSWFAERGVEADDVIATLAHRAQERGDEVIICTMDKDLAQLVCPKIKCMNPRRNYVLIDEATVKELHGVVPSLITDYLALVGDASDNIPGVPGFGPKTAATVINAAGNLEVLLEHPERFTSGKKCEVLKQSVERARLNKKLIALNNALHLESSFEDLMPRPVDNHALGAFYRKFDLQSLLKTITEAPATAIEYTTITSASEWETYLDELKKARSVCIIPCGEQKLVGLGLCVEDGIPHYLPFEGTLECKTILLGLKELLLEVTCYGYDVKKLSHLLAAYPELPTPQIVGDILLASQLLYAHERHHELSHLTQRYLELTLPENNYPAMALATTRLYTLFNKQLRERALFDLFCEIELPLIPILTDMERRGIYLDTLKLAEESKILHEDLEQLSESIYSSVGKRFKINSPLQLSKILEELGLKTGKKTTHGYSTNAEELIKIRDQHPIIPLILQYREWEKLRSTYVDALPQAIDKKTGRIHCSFNQMGTATGRISCQEPNLQNIPIRTAQGKRIRAAFCPQQKGWSFLSADYSQIELRLLAHCSEEPDLLAAFTEGRDIHRHTAGLLFNCPPEEVTIEQRSIAKTVNFGILYGQQPYGLAQLLHIRVKEAATFIEAYFKRYPKVQEYLMDCKEKAKQSGKSTTLNGRERLIPDIGNSNAIVRAAAERLAINTPIQGSAADLIKMAMQRVSKETHRQQLSCHLLLQIHDELLFEVPDEEVELLKPLVQSAMEGAMSLKIPLVVDISSGKNWSEC